MKAFAQSGYVEEGIQMARSSSFIPVGSSGIGAELTGDFLGYQAKAFIAGIVNPHGKSVTVMAVNTSAKYGPSQSQLVQALASSLQFSTPQEAPHNQAWRQELAGANLEDAAFDKARGATGGFSSSRRLTLCSDQSFSSYSSESM